MERYVGGIIMDISKIIQIILILLHRSSLEEPVKVPVKNTNSKNREQNTESVKRFNKYQ